MSAILVVAADAAQAQAISAVLPEHRCELVGDVALACSALAASTFDLIIVDHALAGAVELLHRCQHEHPMLKRLVLTDYADLPVMIGERARGLSVRAINRHALPATLQRIIGETLTGQERPHGVGAESDATVAAELAPEQVEKLLRWTVDRLVKLKRLVIRQPSREPRDLQLQFVFSSLQLETLRTQLVTRWHMPIKPKDALVPHAQRRHPVISHLGKIAENQEIYALQVGAGDGSYLYAALLPWRREARVTLALGLCLREFDASWHQLLLRVHQHTIEHVAEFPLQSLINVESSGAGQMVLEYDWVVTDTYVGPDRRGRPTSLLNRYMVIGRRHRVPSRFRRSADVFVDRFLQPVAWYALAYLLFSTIDTCFTYLHVRGRGVRELNPLLRPLVLHHPAAFIAIKYAFALIAFFIVARFQLFRVGKYLLAAVVAVFILLDIYWFSLLW